MYKLKNVIGIIFMGIGILLISVTIFMKYDTYKRQQDSLESFKNLNSYDEDDEQVEIENNVDKPMAVLNIPKINLEIAVVEGVEKENIKSLGIPLFIMHGGKFEMEEIIKEFNKIEKKSLFNLNTIYYCISLPILNKDKFKAEFLKYIYERIKEYEQFK